MAGDRPDLLDVVRERWRPRAVVAWGERYDSPLWDGRRDGLAYVCEHYACQAPTDTPDMSAPGPPTCPNWAARDPLPFLGGVRPG